MSDTTHSIDDRDVPKTLGMRLHHARGRAGLNIEDAAHKLQMNPQRLCDIESGDALVESTELLRLCACYEVNAETLFEGIEGVQPMAVDGDAVSHLIAGMLGNDSPARGHSFRGLVSLLRGKK